MNTLKLLPFFLLFSLALQAQTNFCLDFGGNQNLTTNTTDDDYFTVPDNNALDFNSSFTMEAWIFRSAASVTEQNLVDKSSNDADCNYRFSIHNNRLAWWRAFAAAPEYSSSTIPANTWVHVAMTLSGGTLKFYINGMLDATVSNGNTSFGPVNTGSLYIGTSSVGTATNSTRFFHGKMDELRIWNVERTAAQIKWDMYSRSLSNSSAGLAALYQFNTGSGTSIVNISTNTGAALNGTMVNSPAWATSPVQFSPNSLRFNGSSYVQLNNRINFGSSSFTLEAWVYPQSTAAGMIFAQDVCGDAEHQFRLYTNNSKVNFDMSDAAALGMPYNFQLPSTANSVPLNVWTHVAVVRNVNTYTIYINGVSNASYSTGANTINNQSGADVNKRLRIGARGGLSGGCGLNYFTGSIDEVRVWNTARTGTEIQQNFFRELDPAANATMLAYYTFNQGVASGTNTGISTLIDQKGSNYGTLTGFTLSGATSNFSSQYAGVNILPLQWVSFNAERQDEQVVLNWSTADEENVNEYEVEHSTNGSEWTTIHRMSAAVSTGIQLYSYKHLIPAAGINFYRIRENDHDGKFGYSAVRSVLMRDGKGNVRLLQNPVQDKTLRIENISGSRTAADACLYTNGGRLVWKKKLRPGINNIYVGELSPGIYILTTGYENIKLVINSNN